MECQILFTGKNKKNIINLSFAENAHRVVKVNNIFENRIHIRCVGGTVCRKR